MADKDHLFNASNQPDPEKKKRGPGKKRLMLEAIRSEYGSEEEYLRRVATMAMNEANPTLLGHVLARIDPPVKSSCAPVEISFPEGATHTQKADAIMDAIAGGDVPPDVGQMLISSIKQIIEIEMGSDLLERLESLERTLSKRLEELDD